jgi:hypothetical protein
MESYITPLNYSIFIILYVTSFVYLYTKYSEIVGLGVLTVIQIAFTLFFGKELSQIIINNPGGNDRGYYASRLSLYSSFISMGLLSVALILTSITIFDIQEKYNDTKGTPVKLSVKYQKLFDTIKQNTLILFIINAISLLLYYFTKSTIDVPVLSILWNQFSLTTLMNYLPAILSMGLTISSIVISSYQVKYAVDFADLKIYSIVGR